MQYAKRRIIDRLVRRLQEEHPEFRAEFGTPHRRSRTHTSSTCPSRPTFAASESRWEQERILQPDDVDVRQQHRRAHRRSRRESSELRSGGRVTRVARPRDQLLDVVVDLPLLQPGGGLVVERNHHRVGTRRLIPGHRSWSMWKMFLLLTATMPTSRLTATPFVAQSAAAGGPLALGGRQPHLRGHHPVERARCAGACGRGTTAQPWARFARRESKARRRQYGVRVRAVRRQGASESASTRPTEPPPVPNSRLSSRNETPARVTPSPPVPPPPPRSAPPPRCLPP